MKTMLKIWFVVVLLVMQIGCCCQPRGWNEPCHGPFCPADWCWGDQCATDNGPPAIAAPHVTVPNLDVPTAVATR